MIEVTLLGCGGGMPLPGRYLSATLITYRGRKILIDCGEGTQVSMRKINAGFKSIDLICITHIHGDHIIGPLRLLGTIGNSGREDPLIIVGPEGIEEAVKAARVIARHLPYEIQVIENPNQIIRIQNQYIKGELSLLTHPVDHSIPCLAYQIQVDRRPKFDSKKVIHYAVPKVLWSQLQKLDQSTEFEGKVYHSNQVMGKARKGLTICLVTDRRSLSSLINFIHGCDLLICEGTYGSNQDINKAIHNKHMTFKEAATLAKNGHVKQLLLTHFGAAMSNPREYLSNATTVFERTILGEDHLNIELNDKIH